MIWFGLHLFWLLGIGFVRRTRRRRLLHASFFGGVLHQVAFVAWAAVEIVKERGCSWQNAIAASAGSLPDIRVARDFVPGRGVSVLCFCFQAIMGEWVP